MLFRELASYLEKLEKTASRIEMTEILAELFRKSDSKEIDKTIYLALGELAPSYRGIILNIADKMMVRILSQASGKEISFVQGLYKKMGDIGNVAQELSKGKGKSEELTVLGVYDRLLETAKDTGEGSQERKVTKMAHLLNQLDPLSAKFVSRIPVGRLRLGFSDKTILDALSWMAKGDKSAKNDLEKAYFVLPDPGLLAQKVKELGLEKAVKEISPIVGVPVLPMLAQRLKSPEEMVKKMGRVAVEPKLDGLRLQIHFDNGKVKAFTRNLNENSWMFPELKRIASQVKAKSVILDCEAVGLDETTKLMANFQTTMTRRRKHEIEDTLAKVGIEFFVFDLVLKNGQNLMNKSYLERRKALEETVKPGKVLRLVDSEVTKEPERINALFRENIKKGFEGVIVKAIAADYFSGRTGWRWVKMKQEETSSAKLADTIDCLVMGYTLGKGKRSGFGVGQFLVGVKDGEKFKTTSKVGTGLTDEQFRELKTRLTKLEVKEKPKEYEAHKNYTPDYWVAPSQVVEIAADEITKSPTHTAGLALRFPRLIKFRDDKSPKEVTTLKELEEFFKMQKS